MARPKGGGAADEETAAEATVAAIAKELEARFDVDLVRSVATKMFRGRAERQLGVPQAALLKLVGEFSSSQPAAV